MYASKIAEICVLWTFWLVIQLIDRLSEIRQKSLLQSRMSRERRFLLFLKHRCLVTLNGPFGHFLLQSNLDTLRILKAYARVYMKQPFATKVIYKTRQPPFMNLHGIYIRHFAAYRSRKHYLINIANYLLEICLNLLPRNIFWSFHLRCSCLNFKLGKTDGWF